MRSTHPSPGNGRTQPGGAYVPGTLELPLSASEATLLDVLIDGFEKNEIQSGFHWRDLPCPTELDARRRFTTFRDEATQWKGPPDLTVDDGQRRKAAWRDIVLVQAGRGVQVRVRAPWFSGWWHNEVTWQGDPMRDVWQWWASERKERQLA